MFTLPSYLWEPQERGIVKTIERVSAGKDVCLYGPTGSGKTTAALTLMQWAASGGWQSCFYVNRRLLIGQSHQRFIDGGLHCGVRAAEFDDLFDPSAPHQVCSADTERSRVYGDNKRWPAHDAQLVIVDEAHMQRGETMAEILADHRSRGARVVLLTATPIGLSDMADELVISGKLSEYRACKALVPAVVRSIEQPDLRKIKRNATGEYVLDGQKRKIYTQTIVGNVLDRWKRYNPDARPTMLYAPGKDESVWFTEQFEKLGVSWCHVDATDAVVDGKRYKLNRKLWQEILERYKAGSIKGLSSRFKLREGIDVPNTYHCILATPIGSLASYIQTVGRVLRYSAETPDEVLVTDHGGNFWRHGSPNHDRPWDVWWNLPEHAISEWHQNAIRDKKQAEPIRCPKCEGERLGGIKCPHCGFTHPKSQRHVVMENGDMEVHDGELVPLRVTQKRYNTEELWAKMFWGFKKKKVDKSFAQMEAFFVHEYHYHPPRDIAFMPKKAEDWYQAVHQVPMGDLVPSKEWLAKHEQGTGSR